MLLRNKLAISGAVMFGLSMVILFLGEGEPAMSIAAVLGFGGFGVLPVSGILALIDYVKK